MAETQETPSKFAEFITTRKLDPRRIINASRGIEALQLEDRAIRLAKRQARSKEDGAKSEVKETRKPRSGRPVTRRAMDAALRGGFISGPTKTRILRAVNHVLGQKKEEPVALRALF